MKGGPAAVMICAQCGARNHYFYHAIAASDDRDAQQCEASGGEAPVDVPSTSLTARQLEVLKLLARGMSVKEVAKRLHVANKTVESHKARIMRSLGLKDRVQLARYAIRQGLITA